MDNTFTQTTSTMAERMSGIRIVNFNPAETRPVYTDELQGITSEFTDALNEANRKISEPELENSKA